LRLQPTAHCITNHCITYIFVLILDVGCGLCVLYKLARSPSKMHIIISHGHTHTPWFSLPCWNTQKPHKYFYLKTIIYKYSLYPSHAHTFHAFFNSGWAGGRTSLLLPAPASASACVYCCSCNSCNLNTYEFQIFYMLKSEVWKCDAKKKIEWAPSSVHPRFLVFINCILIDEMMSCFPYIKLTSTWFDKKRKSKIRNFLSWLFFLFPICTYLPNHRQI
jgi:hypothetical protein